MKIKIIHEISEINIGNDYFILERYKNKKHIRRYEWDNVLQKHKRANRVESDGRDIRIQLEDLRMNELKIEA